MSLPKTHFASEPPREAGSDDASTNAVERAWADRIRAGHMDAFEALYRRYWERLYAFAFRYLRSQQDAEDAVQEVFFRIWRGRADWVPAGAVRNYLYLAVRNAALDRLQRAAVARRRRAARLGSGGARRGSGARARRPPSETICGVQAAVDRWPELRRDRAPTGHR